MFWPLHTANLNAIKAVGRSDLYLKLEIAKNVVGIILLLATMNISVMAMAYSMLVNSVASQIINAWPNKRLLDYGYTSQLADILPSMLLAAVMGFMVRPIAMLPLPTIVILAIQFFVGAMIYLAGSALLRFEPYEYMKQIAQSLLAKRAK
jgi:hypothetical protein